MTVAPERNSSPPRNSGIEAVVIGASSGGVEALSVVLGSLPADYPLPVFVVIHLPPDRPSLLAELFRMKCAIAVKEAEDKEPIVGGTAYFAPPDYHMLVELDKRLSLSSEEPVLFARPSIDVLFETAADAYGASLVGVILTGANSDGANGLKAVAAGGGLPLVQRPDTAFSAPMPQAALDSCPAAKALTLDEIAKQLRNLATLS